MISNLYSNNLLLNTSILIYVFLYILKANSIQLLVNCEFNAISSQIILMAYHLNVILILTLFHRH